MKNWIFEMNCMRGKIHFIREISRFGLKVLDYGVIISSEIRATTRIFRQRCLHHTLSGGI